MFDANDYKYGTSEKVFLFFKKPKRSREQEATSIWAASWEAEGRKYNLKISGKIERMATTHGSNIRKWKDGASRERKKNGGFLFTVSE